MTTVKTTKKAQKTRTRTPRKTVRRKAAPTPAQYPLDVEPQPGYRLLAIGERPDPDRDLVYTFPLNGPDDFDWRKPDLFDLAALEERPVIDEGSQAWARRVEADTTQAEPAFRPKFQPGDRVRPVFNDTRFPVGTVLTSYPPATASQMNHVVVEMEDGVAEVTIRDENGNHGLTCGRVNHVVWGEKFLTLVEEGSR